jgi:uncharacterized membrane protein YfcA
MTYWLALALTALMGVSLGLLGGGGSTLAVPILVHVLGLGAHSAIALSLVLVGSTALLAAGFHHRTTPLPFRESFLLAACGAPFSILGGVASRQVNGALLLLAFGLLMLVMGVLMFRPSPEATESPRRHWPSIVAAGAAVGFLTGFLGVGGGFMIVPALVLLLHMPIKRAVGASLLVIALNCAVAIIGHWSSLEMNTGVILPLMAAALGGTFLGVELCKRFHPPYLHRAFAVFILVVGVFMIARSEVIQSSTPLPTVSITEKTVATITDGDFVHPAFSPDGKKLAYSGVIVENKTELTEIFVRDLKTGNVTRLLDTEKSQSYAVYKSYVFDLTWKDNQKITAHISDGDVDSTVVTFDVAEGKILSEEFSSEEMNIPEFSPLGQRAKATFTDWPEGVLGSALNQPFIQIGDDALVVQKHYAREDDHIWRLDFTTGKITKLMDVPEKPYQSLASGFPFGDSIVFALRQPSRITIYLYQDGEVAKLVEIPTEEGRGRTRVKHHSGAGVLFLLQLHRSYEQGHNPLLLYNHSGLHEIKVENELYDAAVSPGGKLLCLVLWQNNQRHLVIKELNFP